MHTTLPECMLTKKYVTKIVTKMIKKYSEDGGRWFNRSLLAVLGSFGLFLVAVLTCTDKSLSSG